MGHSEVTNRRKGWRDSEKGGFIRHQELCPLAGSRTTVETSWLELESWTAAAASRDACGSRARRKEAPGFPLGYHGGKCTLALLRGRGWDKDSRCRDTLKEAIVVIQMLDVVFSKGWRKCPFLGIIQRKVTCYLPNPVRILFFNVCSLLLTGPLAVGGSREALVLFVSLQWSPHKAPSSSSVVCTLGLLLSLVGPSLFDEMTADPCMFMIIFHLSFNYSEVSLTPFPGCTHLPLFLVLGVGLRNADHVASLSSFDCIMMRCPLEVLSMVLLRIVLSEWSPCWQ